MPCNRRSHNCLLVERSISTRCALNNRKYSASELPVVVYANILRLVTLKATQCCMLMQSFKDCPLVVHHIQKIQD